MGIGALCNWDFTWAAEWVNSKRRGGHCAPNGLEEEFNVQRALEDLFLRTDLQEPINWSDPNAGKMNDPVVVQTAVKWVAERWTKHWVADVNHSHGHAVRSQRVVETYNAEIHRLTENLQVPELWSVDRAAGRMWMLRWRRKHKGKVGFINPQEDISVDEKRSIAKTRTEKTSIFASLIRSPVEPSCLNLGTRFHTTHELISGPKNRAVFAVPFWGPPPTA